MHKRFRIAFVLLFSSLAFAQTPPTLTAIRAGRLIDGTGAAAIPNAVVIIDGNKILAAGPAGSTPIPQQARIIDLGDATILPGLIDSHTHLIGRTLGDPAVDTAIVKDFRAFGAILGVANAEKTLKAGFTTVRNVGADGFDDLALKKAIDDGRILGPRMIASAHALGITGGHCDENAYRPGLLEGTYREGIADGPDQVRAAVRYQVKYGAGVIKTCATGGVLSEGDAVGTTQYTFEELKAMVDEASKLDRKVAAHAHGTEGIKLATRAGVSSIDHGSFLDDEGARMMVERGTYLVPTLSAAEAVERAAKTGVLKGLRAEKALAAAAAARKAIRIAVAHRVPIAYGTDAGVIPHGTNGHEFTLLAEWGGLTPMQTIVAATSSAAKLLGWDDRLGTIASGKLADLVAFPGDPLRDLRIFERPPIFVMKDGVAHVSPTR